MEKITMPDGNQYARISGVGLIKLCATRLPIHEAINARSWQRGLPTRYSRTVERHGSLYSAPEHCRCFISMCAVRRDDYKSSPNRSGYCQPACF